MQENPKQSLETMCTSAFTVASWTAGERWKKLQALSLDKQINDVLYVHNDSRKPHTVLTKPKDIVVNELSKSVRKGQT